MRAKSLFAILFLCFCFVSIGVSPTLAGEKTDAGAFANELGHKALVIITDAANSKTEKRAKLEKLFQQNVDIDWIGKFVLGRNWKDATDEQKKHYLTNYKAFIIRHYTSNLTEYTDANFEVSRIAQEERGGYLVTVRIKRPQSEDVVVDYTVRKSAGDGLKVYDITVEGVSMITTQRSEFSSVVSQKGLDYLIDELAARSTAEIAK